MNNHAIHNFTVSVIIPSYNRAETVVDTIFSVINQSVSAMEIIIIDDGSTDNTHQIIKDTFGNKVNYIYQQNAGVSAARNRGICIAKGNWIALLDSDDIWEREKLQNDLNLIINSGDVEFIHGNRLHQWHDGRVDSGRDHKVAADFCDITFLLSTWTIKTSTVLIKRDVFSRLEEGFNLKLKSCEDYELFWRAIISSKKIAYAEKASVIIKITKDGLSRNQIAKDRLVDNMEAMLSAKKWAIKNSNKNLTTIIQARILNEYMHYLDTIKNTESAISMMKELLHESAYVKTYEKIVYFIQQKLKKILKKARR